MVPIPFDLRFFGFPISLMPFSGEVQINCKSLVGFFLPTGLNINPKWSSMVLQNPMSDVLMEDATSKTLCYYWRDPLPGAVVSSHTILNDDQSRLYVVLTESTVTRSFHGILTTSLSLILDAAGSILAEDNTLLGDIKCCQPKNSIGCTRIVKDGHPKMKFKVSPNDTYTYSATFADADGVPPNESCNCCLSSAFSWEMGSPSCSSRR